jgi:cellobiose-specific phosphotransferase system component IIB
MKKLEIIEKLNQNNNFHLSLKSILATDKEVLNKLKQVIENKNKKATIINFIDNAYEDLLKAYNEKIDYVLISQELTFMLPLVNIITTDCVDVIKPIIPTYYCLKDNKIIQKVKTTCNKKMSKYTAFHSIDELVLETLNYILK